MTPTGALEVQAFGPGMPSAKATCPIICDCDASGVCRRCGWRDPQGNAVRQPAGAYRREAQYQEELRRNNVKELFPPTFGRKGRLVKPGVTTWGALKKHLKGLAPAARQKALGELLGIPLSPLDVQKLGPILAANPPPGLLPRAYSGFEAQDIIFGKSSDPGKGPFS